MTVSKCKIMVSLAIFFILLIEVTSVPISFGLTFNARGTTEEEKNIAERDYLSVMHKCNERLSSRLDSGPTCDAFMGYYLQQCEKMDNLISY